MNKFPAYLLVLFCVPYLAACSRGADYPVYTELVDDVEVVTNPSYPYHEQPVGLEKVLEIGMRESTADDPLLFGNIVDAVVRDDRVYVAEGGDDQRIKIFDDTGTFITMVGRRGSGPREFHQIGYLCVDRFGTLFVYTSGWNITRIEEPYTVFERYPLRGAIPQLSAFYEMAAIASRELILHATLLEPGFSLTSPPTGRNLFLGIQLSPGQTDTLQWYQFGPYTEFPGLRETIDELKRKSQRSTDYTFRFIEGEMYYDDTQQTLYVIKQPYPYQILAYSLSTHSHDHIRTIQRERSSDEKVYVTVSFDHPESLLAIQPPAGFLGQGELVYFREQNIGVCLHDELIYDAYMIRGQDGIEHWVDMFNVETGRYEYLSAVDVESAEDASFIGCDQNGYLYFLQNSPYPKISKYVFVH